MRPVPRHSVQPRPRTKRDILREILQIVREQKRYYKSTIELLKEHISPSEITVFERSLRHWESEERIFEIKFAMLTRRAGF